METGRNTVGEIDPVKQIREDWWKSLDWPGARRAIIRSKVMGLHEWFGDFFAGSGSR